MFKQQILTICLIFFCGSMIAQSEISGTVNTADGTPLPGVNILIKGTETGTVSDLDGNYSIIADGGQILQFSMVGFTTVLEKIPADGVLNITLKEGVLLKKVVVTALGIEREKDAVAYAHEEVEVEPLTLARENSLGDALSGLVPGLNITNVSSGPGGSSRIIIRGYSSVSGNNQPLFVIDGLPIDNKTIGSVNTGSGYDWGDGLTGINPDDIEKISVLKGNAAAALYGSRASNGVILITTKRGNSRKGVGIELNSNFTAEEPLTFYDWQTEYGQGWGPWKPGSQEDAFGSNWFNWGPKMDGEDLVQFDGEIRPFSATDNDIRQFYRTGMKFNNSLALTGEDEKMNWRFGFSNLDNEFIIPNSNYNRKTFTLATGGEIIKNLTTEITGRYILEDTQNRPRIGNSPGNVAYGLAVLPPHVPLDALEGPNGDGSNTDGSEIGVNSNPWITNPYWAAHQFRTEDTKNRIIGSVKMRYDIGDFYVQGRVGTDHFVSRLYDLVPEGTAFNPLGIVNEQTLNSTATNSEFIIGLQKKFKKGYGFDAFFGANRFDYFFEFLGQGGTDFSIPNLPVQSNTINQYTWAGEFRNRTNSLFGSAGFYYKSWMYLNFTGRNDWFSTLPIEDNDLFYPSVGASLIFSELFKMPDFFDYGKVYSSWAQVSSDVDPYSLDLTYQLHPVSFQGNPIGAVTNQTIPDRSLSPSISNEIEIGVDLKFFKKRLGLDVAVYDRHTKNDIIVSTISNASGFTSAFVKEGAIENRGIEVLLTATPVSNKNLEWNLAFNASKNNNKVTNLGTGVESIQIDGGVIGTSFIHHEVGHPASVIKGFEYARDDAGNLIFGADGYPKQGDFVILGNGVHDFIGGITNTIRWKNISASFLIDFKTGAHLLSGTNGYATLFGQHKNTLEGREGELIRNGVNENGEPQTYTFNNENLLPYHSAVFNNIAEEFVYKADFAKLRQVIITYQLPKQWFSKIALSDASISFVGRNLALLYSDVPNIDPESAFNNTNAQGMETFGVPQTRSYGVNLSVKF